MSTDSTPSSQLTKPFSQNNSFVSSNTNNTKRSEDHFNHNTHNTANSKRHDQDGSQQHQRRNDQQQRRSNNDGPKGHSNKHDEVSFKKLDSEFSHNQRRNNQRRTTDDAGPKGYPNHIDDIPTKKSNHESELPQNQRRNDNQNRRSNNNAPKGYPNKVDEIPSKPFKKTEEPKSRTPNQRFENGGTSNSTSSKPTNNINGSNANSSVPTKTVSANNPFSLENRIKFQNEISSSFVKRELMKPIGSVRHTESARSDGTKPRETSVKLHEFPKVHQNDGARPREGAVKSNEFAKPHQNARKGNDGSLNAVKSNPRISKFEGQSHAGVEKGKHVNAKDNPRSDYPADKPFNQRAKSDAKPRTVPATPQDTNVTQLVKATSALKVSEPPRPKPSKSTPVNIAVPAALKTPDLTAVFPNGFEFNPNKIMGFTDKETNEVAQSMLKAANGSSDMLTQLLEAASAASNKLAAQSSLSPLPEAFVPTSAQAQPSPVKVLNNNQQYSVRPMTSPQHQPRQHHQQQQQQQQLTHHQHGMQFMSPFVTPHTQFMSLTLNDECYAKYWEDGLFYRALISGIAEKTCVVKFLEYENYEELLLSDCLPITNENIELVNQYNAGLTMQPTSTQFAHHPQQQPPQLIPAQQQIVQMQQQQQQQPHYVHAPPQLQHQQPGLLQTPQHHHQPSNSYHQQMDYTQYNQHQQHLQRMRGERQMYIPPAQRSSK